MKFNLLPFTYSNRLKFRLSILYWQAVFFFFWYELQNRWLWKNPGNWLIDYPIVQTSVPTKLWSLYSENIGVFILLLFGFVVYSFAKFSFSLGPLNYPKECEIAAVINKRISVALIKRQTNKQATKMPRLLINFQFTCWHSCLFMQGVRYKRYTWKVHEFVLLVRW